MKYLEDPDRGASLELDELVLVLVLEVHETKDETKKIRSNSRIGLKVEVERVFPLGEEEICDHVWPQIVLVRKHSNGDEACNAD